MVCVLRSGGDYDLEYVERLRDGVARFLPGAPFLCLSDVPVPCDRRPLRTNWPGWWAKMEVFAPDLTGDILFMDLDTVICGDLAPLAGMGRLTVIEDWYNPGRVGSGLMYLPEACRPPIWEAFTRDPEGSMARHRRRGDQEFLWLFWATTAARWQSEMPGAILSYKYDRLDPGRSIPEGASVVCFHGKPRPREVGWLDSAMSRLPRPRAGSPSSRADRPCGPSPGSSRTE